ncbi:putative vacuolar fusion protein MON1 B-like [Trypanosoma theileri]|uniref:Putative vacuolar fusion protein MON1 B-like n=1 Tax=Trypanosoma theileri TaxID=67003 RepID=A0A1X0P9E4_9TRYP|nr:putative vacuolar fusion protein MON1 B-like [Trypanosoma theileri]ORC93253.1 putative vacuolar fusion protein MON1 B-like [Trypanosoma theileri]
MDLSTVEENLNDSDDKSEEEEELGAATNMDLQLSVDRGLAVMETVAAETPEKVESRTGAEKSLPLVPQKETERTSSPLTSSSTQASQQLKSSMMTDDILRKHKKHVFILTSSGKPVFSRYGCENEFSDIFGVFQVLINMAQQRCNTGTTFQNQQEIGLRCLTAGDLCIYFHVEGEVYYVLVTRTGESPRSCMRQMRQLHLQLLSLLPNVGDILARCPSYDLRRLISSADVGVIQQLIRSNSHEECYLFRCLSAAPLSVARRRMLETLLARHHGSSFINEYNADKHVDTMSAASSSSSSSSVLAAKHHLFSFFLFRGRIVCAVGPANSDAFLHIDDALLLLNFVRCLAHSQEGEIWAPICLPRYNNTGYLWCYCTNMSVMARESRHARDRSASFDSTSHLATSQHEQQNPEVADVDANNSSHETPADYTKSEGLLLVYIAVNQGIFSFLAEQSYQIARRLIPVISLLEEELSRRENVPLSLVSANSRAAALQHQKMSQLMVMARQLKQQQEQGQQQQQQQQSEGFNVEDTIPPSFSTSTTDWNYTTSMSFIHEDGLQWFAVIFRGQRSGEGSARIVYSEPSSAMRFSAQERKRQLRLVVRRRDQLAHHSQLSEPLLLLHTEGVNILVMWPTPTLVASIMQQFCSTVSNSNNKSSSSYQVSEHNTTVPVTLNEAMSACNRVRELMLIFLPDVPKQQMLRCAMRVMIKLVACEAELSFQQVRGGGR